MGLQIILVAATYQKRIEGKCPTPPENEKRSARSAPFSNQNVEGSGLVLRHLRIDPVGPGQNPARQVMHLLEPGLLKKSNGLRAAHTGAAMRHDLVAGIKFAQPL